MSIPRLKSYLSLFAAVLMLGQVLNAQAEALPDFTTLVEQASPAVVNISTKQKLPDRKYAAGQMPDLEGLPPMFREFFERNMPQAPRSPRGDRQREAQSLGSGFIISADGYILTNNHVVADADEIIVRLSDRSELQAKLVGTDPRTDVALLKVDGKNLPTVKLGDSEKLKVGQQRIVMSHRSISSVCRKKEEHGALASAWSRTPPHLWDGGRSCGPDRAWSDLP